MANRHDPNVENFFNYKSVVTDDSFFVEIKHNCKEACSTKNISFKLKRDEFEQAADNQDEIGQALIFEKIIEQDKVVSAAIHEMHDLISIYQSTKHYGRG